MYIEEISEYHACSEINQQLLLQTMKKKNQVERKKKDG